jgi:hypothetical protein
MSAKKLRVNERVCPLTEDAYQDCYCSSMNSQDIEKIIFFCFGSYKACEVYRLKHRSKTVNKSAEFVVLIR